MSKSSLKSRPMRFLTIAVAGAFVAISAILPANAEDPGAVNDAEVLAAFDDLGIAEETQAALLEKMHNGQPLDSDTTTKPVSTEKRSFAGIETERAVYADGSVTEVSVGSDTYAAPYSGDITTMAAGISGCQAIADKDGWKRRTNCVVKYTSGSFDFGFQANYSVATGKGRVDSVSSRHDLYKNRVPGRKLVDRGTKKGRGVSTSSMYAWGQSWVQTSLVDITTTRYLEIRVKGSAWTATWTN